MKKVQGTISRAGLLATGALLTAALAGCGQQGGTSAQPSSGSATPPSSSSPTTSASSSTSGAPSSSTATPQQQAQPQPDNGLCKARDLELSLGRGDGAAGTVYRPLKFTNVSGRSCVIQGFPGISYVGGEDGHQVGAPAYRDGQKGAPITLNKGETAAADVGFVNVQNYDPVTCQPQAVRGLRVYPPQETESKFVAMEGTGCANDKIPGHQLTVKTIQKGGGD